MNIKHKFLIFTLTLIFFSIFIISNIYADLTTDLLAYYNLDETSGTTVYDSLFDYNGTNNGATINQTGILGKAYSFDGVNDDITLFDTPFDFEYNNAFTISLWYKGTSNNGIFFSKIITSIPNTGYEFRMDGTGHLVGYLINTYPSNAIIITSKDTLNNNNWNHLVLVYNGDSNALNTKLYINGIDNTNYNGITNSLTSSILTNVNVTIGSRQSTGWFSGKMDEIGIWSRALTPTDVSKLYNSGAGLSYDDFIDINTPTASVSTGTYNNDFNVTLSSDVNTIIYYTTDGSDPDNTDTEYTSAIPITATTTLKAIAYDSEDNTSSIGSWTYTMVVSDPVITQLTGTYNNDFTTTITSGTTGASIYYTTDGSVPDNTDTLYSGAITINATKTLKAIAYKTNYTTSGVDTETYTMEVFGNSTADKNAGIYYNPINVALTKAGTTEGTTLTYTTNGTDPTIASIEYTTPITIAINNDQNTTLKFAEFKTGYTASAIQTLEFDIHDANLNIYLYDENTLAKLDGNVSIIDLTNNQTYYADENGLFSRYLKDIDWKEKPINAYVERKVNGVTTHTSRNLQFYWKYEDHNLNMMLLPVNLGESVEFLVKDTNDTLWESRYVQFKDINSNLISSSLTNTSAKFTSYIDTDGNYTATLYDSDATESNTYQKTTVNVKKPKNEKSLADISPYDVEVGGLLIYSLSNQSAAQTSINIFGGTTSTYDFTVVDYNADPVDRGYIPRTYNVKNPFGSSYSTTYNLQPYLITKEDGVIPSIVVYDELKTPFPGITVAIFKQISGSLQLVEQKVTDSTGRTSFAGFPLDVYYIYLYDDGELKSSYQIQVRDTGETFYFVIQRDQVQDIIYKGLDLKYAWNNTPEYVDISTDNVDVNVSVYADYVGDFNITGYTIKTYQNGALKETETGVLSGTSVTFTESFNRLNYTAGMPIKVVVDVTFTYAGQTKNLNIIKPIAVDSKTSGLLNVLQNFPEKVGVLWTILLSILLTIGLLVLVGTSDFVSKDYLIYVGLLVIGFFVYIGWMATGIEVFGMDSMWFIYIVTVIAAVGFALQDSQR